MQSAFSYFQNPLPHRAPPLWLTGFEPSRAVAEFLALKANRDSLLRDAKADGHPVLIFPGLMTGDISTKTLRSLLTEAGYAAHGWGMGINRGPLSAQDLEADITALIDNMFDQHGGRRISIIGWSLGGLYARLAAHKAPDKVRQVITLGSPVSGSPRYTNAWRLYELLSSKKVDDQENAEYLKLAQQPLPVPCTSVYSKTDSIVAWQIAKAEPGKQQENVRMLSSHVGMANNPAVVELLLNRLAQPENDWQPFRRSRG